MIFSKQITPPKFIITVEKNIIFFMNMIFSKQITPPNGRAERLGTPELQTKLDRFCLYKNMIFHMNMTFSNRPDVESQKHARAARKKAKHFLGYGPEAPRFTRAVRARARALSIGEILPSSMIVSPNEIANSLNHHVLVRPKKRPP